MKNSDRDELVQISEYLSNYEDLDAVHIVSHGEAGQLSFGNATLNSDTLPEYEEVLEEWSLALDAEADLLLYGCDVALDESGNSFVEELSQITDADVSASIDDTGIDGDWELETAVGEVEASSIFDDEINNLYQHNLDVSGSISQGFDGGGGSGGGDTSGALDDFDDQVNDELFGDDDDDDDDDEDNDDNDDNSGSDVSFTGDQFFDADFYLEQNTDVAEDGVDPLKHYAENGWKEGRDPNKIFDTSFYLEQNPDVRDAGVNPLQHYYEFAASDETIRYPDLVFQSFGESSGALVASADLSGSQFEEFKNLATQENEVAFAPALAIPFIIVNGNTILAITAASLGLIATASNIQELLDSSDTEVFVPEGDIDPSTPPFDLGEATRINPESFPNSNDFLDGILDGNFEFPTDDAGGVYFLAAGRQGNEIGDLREEAVADLVGGILAKDSKGQDIELFEEGASASVPVDVFGPNGELILVGGPKKGENLGKLGGILKNIKIIAEARGVTAQYYFSDNTPENVIKFAEKRLEAENVFTFPEVNAP